MATGNFKIRNVAVPAASVVLADLGITIPAGADRDLHDFSFHKIARSYESGSLGETITADDIVLLDSDGSTALTKPQTQALFDKFFDVSLARTLRTITGDTGTFTVDAPNDSLSLIGAGGLTVDISGDTITLDATAISGTVTSVAATQPLAGLTITGSPITTSGTFVFALANDLAALEGLGSTGFAVRTLADTWIQRTITGAPARITLTNGDGVAGDPIVDIAATYVGQASITTLGTITTGTWNATTVATGFGGTGLTTIGTANQVLGVNAGASALEYKSILAGTNVSVVHGVGAITIGSAITLQDEGIAVTATPHPTLNFTGGGVTVTDAGGGVATITIPTGGTTLQLYDENPTVFTSPSATGSNSVAIGDGATVSGDNAFAFGTNSNVTAANSYAIGTGASVTAADSIAIGENASATNINAIAIGTDSLASGPVSVAIGESAVASGAHSFAFGHGAIASASHSMALIEGSVGRLYGGMSQGSGTFAAGGDAQTTIAIARAQTTTAAVTEAFLDGAAATQRMVLPNDSTWAFRILVSARRTDANNESAVYQFVGGIDRNATAATTAIVGTVSKTVVAEDTAAWDCNVNADTTNGALRIQVTGEAAKTIRWVARAELVEVTG